MLTKFIFSAGFILKPNNGTNETLFYRNNNNGSLRIYGGLAGSINGSCLVLNGIGNDNNFQLVAADSSYNNISLIGKADGTLTWNEKSILTSSEITTSSNRIMRNVDNSYLYVGGGTGLNKGSFIMFTGKDTNEAGRLELVANNGTNDARLKLNPDGTFVIIPDYANYSGTQYNLGEAAIVSKFFSGTTQYIKYASGLIIQWGLTLALANTTSRQINYPISFTSSAVTTLAERANTSDVSISVVACQSDYNQNGFTAYYKSVANELSLRWFAIGK